MLEPSTIQQMGFRNVTQGGKTDAFQLRVRCPYYRGIWASLLERVDVVVDGETFPPENIRWGLGGKTFTMADLAAAPEVRWPFEEAAVLTVEKPGGLSTGLHEVRVAVTWRWSYIPIEFQPTTNLSERQLVLTH